MAFTTINPATEEVLATYELMSSEAILSIARQSRTAFDSWKKLSFTEKSPYFLKLASVLREHIQKYAELITKEMGKPITESLAEVEKCASLAEELITLAPQWLREEEVHAGGKKHLITFEPLGSLFIIMPWNFPFWQPFKVALPPLIAGNTIILKHARNVTGSSLAIEDAFRKAGFPEHVFRSVIADHEGSERLIASPDIAACSLTGSVAAGSQIALLAGKYLKKAVLELGGSDAHIILDDADVEQAAQGAVKGKIYNAGQVCIGSKRFIVHRKIADAFISRFGELMESVIVSNPLDKKSQMGPLVNAQAVQDMERFIADAVQRGAVIVAGGKRKQGKGFFFEPTVLGNVTEQMNVSCQEVFGPVAPVLVVDSDDEAVRIANSSEFGLNASVWTKNLTRGEMIARKLDCGGVFINANSKSHFLLPLGGVKKSGFGRELSSYGIKEFVNIKTINTYESL